MEIQIGPLRKKDFNAARRFAVEGMHLAWYTGNRLELYLYSKYFWALEISRATIALGAYRGDALAGVLLVDMEGQPKVFSSFWRKALVRLASFLLHRGYQGASGTYDAANQEMLRAYKSKNKPDGEIAFFAVAPDAKGKGLGTQLLRALEQREKGKQLFLFTDSGSTYQFYAHRGFDEVGRKDIVLTIHGKKVPLTCFLYSKTL